MMMIRTMYFLGLVGIFLIFILGYAAYFYARYRRREMYPYGRWEDLLKRLGPLDYDKLALIARGQAMRRVKTAATVPMTSTCLRYFQRLSSSSSVWGERAWGMSLRYSPFLSSSQKPQK
jgi:hypothetical protein